MTGIKRIVAVLFLAMVSFAAMAGDVTPEKARKAAELFFAKNDAATRSAARLTLVNADEVHGTRSSAEGAAYYIFNREGGGFVIISAIDAARPVLGYSLESSFSLDDDMPENLREWMADYRSAILSSRRSGAVADAVTAAMWDDAMTATRATSMPDAVDLGTPDWKQGAPCNRLCPVYNDTTTLAGCVAVAISQLMGYYRYPEAGTGTLPGYTVSKRPIEVPSRQLGHKYDWDNMLSKYSSYNNVQATAVATLVYDVAVMAKASFGPSATSASTSSALPRLATYMGYDAGMARYGRDYSSAEEWAAILKEQIGVKGQPVVISGYSDAGGGHAFLVDGYDSRDRFLINWGWNGSSNGYFELDAFGKYNNTRVAYVDIRPRDTNVAVCTMRLYGYTASSGNVYAGVTYLSGNVTPGETFKVRYGGVQNYGFNKFNGRIGLSHVSADGTVKQQNCCTSKLELSLSASSYSGYSSVSVVCNNAIEPGDVLVPVFSEDGGATWKTMGYKREDENITGRFPLHISDYSSLQYNKATGKFLIITFGDASWTLTSPSGENVTEGVRFSSGALTIDTSTYAHGVYKLVLRIGVQSTTVMLTI